MSVKRKNIESANLIKKETRPCPQCAVPIYKISGCDQMWCTQCQIAFSWNTGKVVVGGTIHNPHYFQFMRNGGVIGAERNPDDVVCGGIPNMYHMHRAFSTILYTCKGLIEKKFIPKNPEYTEIIIDFISNKPGVIKENLYSKKYVKTMSKPLEIFDRYSQCLGHNRDIISEMRRVLADRQNNIKERVLYIVGKTQEDIFKRRLITKSRNVSRQRRILQVLEILETVNIENFNEINRSLLNCIDKSKNIKSSDISYDKKFNVIFGEMVNFIKTYNESIERCEKVASYCREEISKINKNYNSSGNSYQINKYFKVEK